MTTITIDRALALQILERLLSQRLGIEQYIDVLREALNAPEPQPQPLSLDQISMIFYRVYPAQPLSQNIINLVQEVEKHHGIR